MEKFLKEYGVILLLYIIMIFGVILLNNRMNTLRKMDSIPVVKVEKGFTK